MHTHVLHLSAYTYKAPYNIIIMYASQTGFFRGKIPGIANIMRVFLSRKMLEKLDEWCTFCQFFPRLCYVYVFVHSYSDGYVVTAKKLAGKPKTIHFNIKNSPEIFPSTCSYVYT